MENDKDLKMALGWNQRNMKTIGIWPDPTATRHYWDNCKALFCLILMVLAGVGPQTANLFFIWGDVELVTENLSTANIPGMNVMMKIFIALYYRDSFKPVIQYFYNDWREPRPEDEREIMRKTANVGRLISIWGTILTMMMETTYLSLRLFFIISCDKNEERMDHLAIYPSYFPYDLRRPLFLTITNFSQVVIGYLATTAYTTVDTFIAMLVIHICGQFKILKMKLKRLMGDQNCGKSPDLIQKELAEIVKKHEYLNQFAAKIEDCFNVLLLIQLLLCTVEICFQGFLFFNVILTEENGLLSAQMFFFVLFVLFILVHVYIYCFIGEMLLVQNKEVGDSAYESNWFNVPPPEAKNLLLIMNRSHRPLYLTAGKFSVFSMELFSTILKTAMGYLSVLLTVTSTD